MTANVPSATRRVYVRGDMSSPSTCELFDADTDKPLTTVEAVQFTVEVGAFSVADLRHHDGTQERVEIVPAPPLPDVLTGLLPGSRLLCLSVEQRYSPQYSAMEFHLRARTYQQQPNGVERMMAAGNDLEGIVHVDDFQLANANNPEDIIMSQLRLLGGDLGQKLIEQLLFQHPAFLNKKPPTDKRGVFGGVTEPVLQTGGRVKAGAGSIMPPPCSMPGTADAFTPKPRTCPECKGKGEVQMFNTVVPCSRGCAKP